MKKYTSLCHKESRRIEWMFVSMWLLCKVEGFETLKLREGHINQTGWMLQYSPSYTKLLKSHAVIWDGENKEKEASKAVDKYLARAKPLGNVRSFEAVRKLLLPVDKSKAPQDSEEHMRAPGTPSRIDSGINFSVLIELIPKDWKQAWDNYCKLKKIDTGDMAMIETTGKASPLFD